MRKAEVHPFVAQRIITEFLSYEGIKLTEILRRLQAQLHRVGGEQLKTSFMIRVLEPV